MTARSMAVFILKTEREIAEVFGAYSLIGGSILLLLGLVVLKGESKNRIGFFLSLAVPAGFLLMIAYVCLMPW